MTFLLGWQNDDGVYICADSAVTRKGKPDGATSSFGENQEVDGFAVEERAVKLLELPKGVLVAICGDMGSALDFTLSMQTQLAYTEKSITEILDARRSDGGQDDRFELLIGHRTDAGPTLTAFRSADGFHDDIPANQFVTLGSMPEAKKELAALLAQVVTQTALPPQARLAATLVALQAIGITEYLPQHYVGGAFFGARVGRDGVNWQPDLCYVTYPPGMFKNAPLIKPGDDRSGVPSTDSAENIRVLVCDGAGILLSSLGEPRARVLIPPTSTRSEDEWESIVLAAVPPPFRLLVPSVHFGLCNVGAARAVYVYNPTLHEGSLNVMEFDGKVAIGGVPRLVESLELAVPEGHFLFTVVNEDPSSMDAKTYRVKLPV